MLCSDCLRLNIVFDLGLWVAFPFLAFSNIFFVFFPKSNSHLANGKACTRPSSCARLKCLFQLSSLCFDCTNDKRQDWTKFKFKWSLANCWMLNAVSHLYREPKNKFYTTITNLQMLNKRLFILRKQNNVTKWNERRF